MSERFIRCPHCRLPHDALQAICPPTGKAVPTLQPLAKSDRAIRFEEIRGSPRPAPRRELVGKTIGRKYVLHSVLGSGGMGTVFDGEHVGIGRRVAVKVLHASQSQQREAVQRFHREARAAGCIGHPNVCEVYDLDTLDDGSPYLVMQRLDGETLARRIFAERILPLPDVVGILEQVLSALVAAHDRHIVHRDVKPENVFLVRRIGSPPLAKLLDFGVSKTIGPPVCKNDDDVELTRSGMVMGTPYYMSPEQARGDRDLDVRVDIYACGVILYELLTGHRPFVASSYRALLREVISAKPRPARELRRTLPSGFDAILERAMAGNRDDRYRTAAAFQRDLLSLRDRHGFAPHLGPGRVSFGRPMPPPRSLPDVHEQPTRVWAGRLPDDVDDLAPTRAILRTRGRKSEEDHDTIVRLRLPDRLLRAPLISTPLQGLARLGRSASRLQAVVRPENER